MIAPRALACLVVVAAACLAAGCSTRVRDTEGLPDFGEQLAAAPTLAVATVTVDPAVDGVFTDGDQVDADDAFYGAFLAGGLGLDVWHPETVRELAGAETFAALAADYASLGRLKSDEVGALSGPLAGCRFLAVARLTEDRIRTLAQNQNTSDPVARAEGQGEHGDPWSAIVSVERQVRVTLEIFDLASGESVWRSEATSRDKQLYDYDNEAVVDPATYLAERLAAVDGPVYLSRHGDALRLPDLVALIRRALGKLVETLPGARS